MRKVLKRAKELGVAFVALQGMVMAGTYEGPAGFTLPSVLERIVDFLTDKNIVIPAATIAGAIGLYELMFSSSRGGEKIGKALLGGALLLAIISIIRTIFS